MPGYRACGGRCREREFMVRSEGLRYYSKCDSLQMLEMEQPVVRRSLGAGRDVGCGGSSGTT